MVHIDLDVIHDINWPSLYLFWRCLLQSEQSICQLYIFSTYVCSKLNKVFAFYLVLSERYVFLFNFKNRHKFESTS